MDEDPASLAVEFKVGSIDTNVEERDKDLRSKRFFNVEKYPTIEFESSEITGVAGQSEKQTGTASPVENCLVENCLFPRYAGTAPGSHATFRNCAIGHLNVAQDSTAKLTWSNLPATAGEAAPT